MSDDKQQGAASVETRADYEKSPSEFTKHWLEAIELSSEDEKDWREDAAAAIARFSKGKSKFNILYANTQTTVPALYNSEPAPDVRRRFGDPDETGRAVATLIERAISVQSELYDFDGCMKAAVKDRQLPGRGVSRVRLVKGPSGSQHIECEAVVWDDFRHGPAKTWRDVPWVAYRHRMTREELVGMNPELGADVNLDAAVEGKQPEKGKEVSDQFKRATVWEVWDRESRRVYFFAESYKDAPLSVTDDPYRLRTFFPGPKPLYQVDLTDTLTPVCEFMIWKALADEVDSITARISAIVKVMKWRGLYDGAFANLIEKLNGLNDGELGAAEDSARAMQQGGIDKAIWLMPIEQAATAVQSLYEAREQAKNQLYELTGVADILRGSTQASETATAQQIKAQWGSLRLQEAQRDVQRYARDLYRLVADMLALLDEADLQAMTGIPVTPDMAALLRQDLQREYMIDIETDSTIRADLTRAQENVAGFVTGFGTFVQSVGPAVQAGMMPAPVAVKLLTAFARNFKLGREAETALDEWTKYLEQQAQQPPQPDPAAEAEQAKAQAVKDKAAADQQKTGMQMQRDQQKHGMEMQKLAAETQAAQITAGLDQQRMQAEVAVARALPPQPGAVR